MRSGSGATPHTSGGGQTAGYVYVAFSPAFNVGVTPRVVATVKDSTDPIIISITGVTNNGFYVRTLMTYTQEHYHEIGNTDTSNAIGGVLAYAALNVRTSQTSPGYSDTTPSTVGALIASASGVSGSTMYTGKYVPQAGESLRAVGAAFDWIATA